MGTGSAPGAGETAADSPAAVGDGGRPGGLAPAGGLRSLDGPWRALRAPGPWLWLIVAVGIAARIHLVGWTPGTLDVVVWQGHAQEIAERGVVAYYHGGRFRFNHPPLMGHFAASLLELSEATSLPFALLLRAPFALLDAATAALLVVFLGGARSEALRRARFVLGALYWISPLAMIFSAYHGNSDSAVASLLLLAALFASRGRAAACGVAIGLGLWIKIPGVLCAPLLVLAFTEWRARLRVAGAAAVTALLGYAPWLWQDAEAVLRAVFLYPGLVVRTLDGTPIWGLQAFYPDPATLSAGGRATLRALAEWRHAWNTVICLAPIALWSWLRRGRRDPQALASGITGVYAILFALSNAWSFQYLAWPLPFWFATSLPFALGATLLGTAYVYGLYAWLCGDWLLRGEWDFIGKPAWPTAILWLRNAGVFFFLAAAIAWYVAACRDEWRRWQSRASVG